MATINYTADISPTGGYARVEWATLADGDDGQLFDCAGMRIASVHAWGTYSGSNLDIEGSNRVSPADFKQLFQLQSGTFFKNPRDGNNIDFVGAVRPVLSGGSGNIGVAIMFVRD